MGLSGAASLALQVIWTRLAASILGPTTYAFSAVVAVFVGGLAVGSAIGVRLAVRSRQPMLGLALCVLASVALAAAAASGVDRALLVMIGVVAGEGVSFSSVLIRQALLLTLLLAPMAIAFGAAFPFAVAAGTNRDEIVVSDLGLIYAVNTCGAIAGALVTGFVLIDSFGLHNTIRIVTIVVAAGVGALLVVTGIRGRSRILSYGACAVVIVMGLFLPAWNQPLLASGVYKYASDIAGSDVETWLTSSRLLYYREGATATVAVRESLGTRSLSIDGKVDASNGADMLTQKLLAHLPLLLHPNPRRVAIVGLGSGVTVGAALEHPITSVDVLEISPEVVEASRLFESENQRALADPRTRLIIGDGRLHLRLSRSPYDVIVSEPSNPWIAGVASLFTREFFEMARANLTPGGVLCQWAHTYDMSDEDLRSIVATFLSVFPNGALWQIGKGDVLLLGAAESLDRPLGEIARHWARPGVVDDLNGVGVREPFGLLSMFVAEGQTLARYAGGARIQTDDRSELAFSGPRSIFGEAVNRNDQSLRQLARQHQGPPVIQAARHAAGPASWRNRGWMLLKAEVHEAAWYDFARAVESDPGDVDAYEGLIRASVPGATPGVDEALTLLRRLAADESRLEPKVALSRLLAANGKTQEATAILLDLYRRVPDNPTVLEQLASVLSDLGDADRLPAVVAALRRVAPDAPGTRYQTAALLVRQGRPDLAVPEAESVVRDDPRHALAQNVLGVALANLGQTVRARQAFEASLRANPFSSRAYANLGALEMEAGRSDEAAWRFAESLMIDPSSEAARRGLEQARAAGAK
jgi:spermidine synthase